MLRYDEAVGFPQLNYFITNLQGDVIAVCDNTHAPRFFYSYDAWGKLLSVKDANGNDVSQANNAASWNILRYRGYVYDRETGLYYVASRYYDPEIGRWINADDAIAGVGGDIRGYNLFAYCMNDPVNMSDHTGHWPQWIKNAANAVVNAVKKAVTVVVNTVKSAVSSASNILKASLNSLPKKRRARIKSNFAKSRRNPKTEALVWTGWQSRKRPGL